MADEQPLSKNERAWALLFEKYNILPRLASAPYVEIAASEINTVREARLMTKFDHSYQLPPLFQKYKLAILPLSRGSYALGRFATFHAFEKILDPTATKRVAFPAFLESLTYNTITSESAAIHVAYAAGILADFTHEPELHPTISGRMGTEIFDFQIEQSNHSLQSLHVENAQIEIDGGYESERALYLIEAKNHFADDFIVRQLYYPYRLWSARVKKPVRLIYLIYSDGSYWLYEYRFTEPLYYHSIECVRKRKYTLDDTLLSERDLEHLLQNTPIVSEDEALPFPQADSFERLINLCEILMQRGKLSKEEIAENYGFAYRQANYYVAAGRYLGWFAEQEFEGEKSVVLSSAGVECFQLPLSLRRRRILATLLSHRLFREVLQLYLAQSVLVPIRPAVQKLLRTAMPTLSATTIERRAYTLIAWVQWILDKIV